MHIGSNDVPSAVLHSNPVRDPSGIENRRRHTKTPESILPEPNTGTSNGDVGLSEMLPGAQDSNLLDSTTSPDMALCSDCDASFTGHSRKTNLQRHKSTRHRNGPRLNCTFPGCSITFARVDNLDRHMQQQHKSPFSLIEMAMASGWKEQAMVEEPPEELKKTTANLLTSTTAVLNTGIEQVSNKRLRTGRRRALSPNSRAHAATIRQYGACASCKIRKIKACKPIYNCLFLPIDMYQCSHRPVEDSSTLARSAETSHEESKIDPDKSSERLLFDDSRSGRSVRGDRHDAAPQPTGFPAALSPYQQGKVIDSNDEVFRFVKDRQYSTPSQIEENTVSTSNDPFLITYYVYSNCIDPHMHFARTSRAYGKEHARPKGSNPEQFVIIAGSCHLCGD